MIGIVDTIRERGIYMLNVKVEACLQRQFPMQICYLSNLRYTFKLHTVLQESCKIGNQCKWSCFENKHVENFTSSLKMTHLIIQLRNLRYIIRKIGRPN